MVASGIEPGTSAFVARNSDHQTTEAVTCFFILNNNYFNKSCKIYYDTQIEIQNIMELVSLSHLKFVTAPYYCNWLQEVKHHDVDTTSDARRDEVFCKSVNWLKRLEDNDD
jgi:hypothetical protein